MNTQRCHLTRPPCPDALIRRSVDASPGPDVLDLGCGTGIAVRFRQKGCTMLGVEPDPRMAEFARHSGLEAEVARFETRDSADRSCEALVAGTTWHWIDPALGITEAARVRRPGKSGPLRACLPASVRRGRSPFLRLSGPVSRIAVQWPGHHDPDPVRVPGAVLQLCPGPLRCSRLRRGGRVAF
ncbi:methyltransferase domain-containing protein [Paeniglutamicibacter cryotolerans]|uniref:class I SAM-dependent methyltransferase n=1 Tax=Paeniglutamicibacter cryotolerans TaxID=670079 RepID=UPI001C8618C1